MRSIHLARKPLEGTVARNALKWGTAGLNIDASRIGSVGGTKSVSSKGVSAGVYQDGLNGWGVEVINKGRWPTNVVFEHAEGCRLVGTLEVPAGLLYGEDEVLESGTLLAEQWECVEGCPLRKLRKMEPVANQFFLQIRGEDNK